jgi:hypothetical protein
MNNFKALRSSGTLMTGFGKYSMKTCRIVLETRDDTLHDARIKVKFYFIQILAFTFPSTFMPSDSACMISAHASLFRFNLTLAIARL